MKKLLTCLASLTITASSAVPILGMTPIIETNSQKQSLEENKADGYKVYQAKDAWEKYMNKNQIFTDIVKDIGGLGSEYKYKGTDFSLENVKNKKQPIGTLLMNGKIHTTVGSPSMASQHMIDNSNGPDPITVDYDSKTVTNVSTVSASFAVNLSTSITSTAGIEIPFANASVSTTLSFNTSVSSSATSSVEQEITFDKFSTTVQAGNKVEVDYVVMQNLQMFNMVLKGKLNLSNCKFNFESNAGNKKSVIWATVAKDANAGQNFARQISKSLNSAEIGKGVQSLLSVDKISDPTISEESQYYDPNIVYIYLPLSFSIDGYSTLITQSKITE